jgi:hypothetical protein
VDQKYKLDEFGVLHQENPEPFVYDMEYAKQRYDALPDRGRFMAYYRLGALLQHTTMDVLDILDVGYGNGAFLDATWNAGLRTYGHDVSNYPLEEMHTFLGLDQLLSGEWKFDIVTFFDSLEHMSFPLNFLSALKTTYIMISVPWYHPEKGEAWFEKWKHRRPNEHLHHFSKEALEKMLNSIGYKLEHHSDMEDALRLTEEYQVPNILTCIFKKI